MLLSSFPRAPLACALSLLFAHAASATWAADSRIPVTEYELETIVITAPPMSLPLEARINTKTAQQPQPANDGASVLKTIPGVFVIRKGGTDGDPVFRGMAASRLNILLDGERILGGCGGRMDPPTAYIFPDAFDEAILHKGPQSVLHGPGASAGTVRFERKAKYFATPGVQAHAAFTVGSFDRYDAFVDVKGGNASGYVEGIATYAHSGDYKDGKGQDVHSRYERKSATAIVGWTTDRDTRLEFSAVRSQAEAAYADRGMDGSAFDRENYAMKFAKARIGGLIDRVDAQVYYNHIDHVMDNYTLRDAVGMSMASNPDRKTRGGRFAVTLLPAIDLALTLGIDRQADVHTGRSGGGRGSMNDYRDQKRMEDLRFSDTGIFAETRWQASDTGSVIAGLRGDRWRARDSRKNIGISGGMSGMSHSLPNPTVGKHRRETLKSGFLRYEREFVLGTAYAGIGRSERAPDFWEFGKEAAGAGYTDHLSNFETLKTEKTTQLDLGATLAYGPWQGFVSLFHGKHDDYILIQSQYEKSSSMGMTPMRRASTVGRNIDAMTWGGEAGVSYRFTSALKGAASLAYTRGRNQSDHRALAQIPPLEGRFSLDWAQGAWSAGALWRLVAKQGRYALHEGSVVGQDLGKSGGFGVFSVHGGYRWGKTAYLVFGADNLFDKTYAEHLSKGGAALAGYAQTTRVNEPGRSLWLRAQFALD
jgi:iron complex outermembrane receptor protein